LTKLDAPGRIPGGIKAAHEDSQGRSARNQREAFARLITERSLAPAHPQQAIDIYQARIDPIVGRGNNGAYDEAAELVGMIGKLMKRIGKDKELAAWLGELRAKHKAKRNFMRRLERFVPASS